MRRGDAHRSYPERREALWQLGRRPGEAHPWGRRGGRPTRRSRTNGGVVVIRPTMSPPLSHSYRWKPRVWHWPTPAWASVLHAIIQQVGNRITAALPYAPDPYFTVHRLADQGSRSDQRVNERSAVAILDKPCPPKNNATASRAAAEALGDPPAFPGLSGGGISENTHCVGSLGMAVSCRARRR